MIGLKITIRKFISDDQPGFVECSFFDALHNEHIVQEKVPIVTEKQLDANSNYPQDGIIACEIIGERQDTNGRKIYKVNTSKPWGVDTINGLTEFDVLEEQVIELNW
jgi:hypothetical protein